MNEVMDFVKVYLPKLAESGTALGGFMGAVAFLTGYAIKQALGFFDK